MSVNLIFKIAAVGILVTVISQVLKHSGREEHAFLTSLAGLLIVLFWIVPYIYDLFAIAGMLILSYNADKLSKYSNVSVLSNFKLGAKRQYIVAMAAICMVLPLFGIILAPHPQVYLKFSYFYMNEYSNTGVDYLYHRTIMKILTYISFAII